MCQRQEQLRDVVLKCLPSILLCLQKLEGCGSHHKSLADAQGKNEKGSEGCFTTCRLSVMELEQDDSENKGGGGAKGPNNEAAMP